MNGGEEQPTSNIIDLEKLRNQRLAEQKKNLPTVAKVDSNAAELVEAQLAKKESEGATRAVNLWARLHKSWGMYVGFDHPSSDLPYSEMWASLLPIFLAIENELNSIGDPEKCKEILRRGPSRVEITQTNKGFTGTVHMYGRFLTEHSREVSLQNKGELASYIRSFF